MNATPLIIPITDFIRNTKYYSDLLPDVGTVTVTRDGRPYMDVKLNNIERNRRLLKFAGIWKGTGLDDDKLWAKVFARRNRKKPITL
jgi:hypothetical protein